MENLFELLKALFAEGYFRAEEYAIVCENLGAEEFILTLPDLEAIKILKKRNDAETTQALCKALEENSNTKIQLIIIGILAEKLEGEGVIKALIATIINSENHVSVRIAAIRAAKNEKEKRINDALADCVEQNNPKEVKLAALEALKGRNGADVISALKLAFETDPSEEVRIAAADMLLEKKPEGLVSIFLFALTFKKEFLKVKQYVVDILTASLDDELVVRDLIDALSNEDEKVKEFVTEILKKKEGKEVIKLLIYEILSQKNLITKISEILKHRVENGCEATIDALLAALVDTNFNWDRRRKIALIFSHKRSPKIITALKKFFLEAG